LIPRIQERLPQLLALGGYAPDKRVGPAIWLRCAIGCTSFTPEKASHTRRNRAPHLMCPIVM